MAKPKGRHREGLRHSGDANAGRELRGHRVEDRRGDRAHRQRGEERSDSDRFTQRPERGPDQASQPRAGTGQAGAQMGFRSKDGKVNTPNLETQQGWYDNAGVREAEEG
jgi:hypothetical protein